MKKLMLFLTSVFCFLLNSSAQQRTFYYVKNGGDFVENLDSADFIRIIQEPEEKTSLFLIQEFYKNGVKKSIGSSSTIDPPEYEGQFASFFENGKRKQFMYYNAGKIVDTVYNYYPNGKLYYTAHYQQPKDTTIIHIGTVRDSTGTEMAKNGNGDVVLYDDDFKYVTGKGKIKNGERDGEWTGEDRLVDTLFYREIYENAKVISGESTDGKGNIYKYTNPDIHPEFPGGIEKFYRYIGINVNYPPELAMWNIQGVAFSKFIIRKDGSVDKVQVVNRVRPEMAAEAIRVLKGAKGWKPGIYKGKPIDVTYNVPVSFTLSN